MENHVRKWLRRSIASSGLAITGILCLTMVVMAAVGLITDLRAVSYSTSISLNWIPASGSNSTIIRYSTVTYPNAVDAGTSAYNGVGSFTTVEDLESGTPYYFSAWGYDGSDYSASALERVFTTLPATTENTTIPYPKPALPAETWQDPDSSGWDIDPIDDIFAWFADPTVAHGGLGMPTDNLIMFGAGVLVTGLGITTYVKWRNFFSSWFIVLILCAFLSTIEVMQWIIVGLLLLVGAGVWAIDKSTQ